MNEPKEMPSDGPVQSSADVNSDSLMYEALSQVQNAPLYTLNDVVTEFDWGLRKVRESIRAGTFPMGIALNGKDYWLYDELLAMQFAKRADWSTSEMQSLVARIDARRPDLRSWILAGLSVIWLSPSREFES